MAGDATVYVIDDDEASADSLQALLTANDFAVRLFHSAESFLNVYSSSRHECLVLDVRLDGISGLDLQKDLASRGVEIPTIMISGDADQQSRHKAIENGAVDFLEKPFSGRELCASIRKAMAMDG